jgi:hypothetical protein
MEVRDGSPKSTADHKNMNDNFLAWSTYVS